MKRCLGVAQSIKLLRRSCHDAGLLGYPPFVRVTEGQVA